MAISKGTIKSGGSIVFPRTSIDNIVKSTDSSTTYVATNGKIAADYLTSANGTAVGVVYNNDTDHLTITNGGLSINTYTANLTSATTAANLKKVPVVSAVKNYVSTYTHSSDILPQSAVSGLTTALNNKQGLITVGGSALTLDSNNNLSFTNWLPVSTVPAASTTVTLNPDTAYVIYATTTSKTLNTTNIPVGYWGRERDRDRKSVV